TKTLHDNNIRLATIGDTGSLPDACRKELEEAIANTNQHNGMTLILALSYSSRWEIVEATKNIGQEVAGGKLKPNDLNAEVFGHFLNPSHIPDPELLIRTSGEHRISNFLLWQ